MITPGGLEGPRNTQWSQERPGTDFLTENLNREMRGLTLNHLAVSKRDGALKGSKVSSPFS